MAAVPSTRVGQLTLHVRAPGSLEPELPQVRQQIERRLVVAVLEEHERLLHEALGAGVLIRIRKLALHWSLDASALADAATVTRLATELARDVLSVITEQPAPERLRPASPLVVVFASTHHALAARLADVADERLDAWFYAGAPSLEQVWDELASTDMAGLEEILRWLERMERIEPVLMLAPERVLERVASAVPTQAARCALVRARRAHTASARSPEPASGAPRAPAPSQGSPVPPRTQPPPSDQPQPGPVPVPDGAVAHGPWPAPATTQPAEPVTPAVSAAAPAPASAPASVGAAAPAGEQRALSVGTRHAGLFYLAARVLEIELAESLWAVGVREGDLLAHVARTLLPPGDDPAWRWFGAAFDAEPELPVLPTWAIAEVSARAQHGLGRRLVHFGIHTTPEALGTALERLSASAPTRAAGDPATAEVVARCAAALVYMLAARLGQPPSWALAQAVVARPGQLVLSDEALRVVLPASAIDLDHRRGGLDQDPGWVPWLGRRLAMEFVGVEVL